MATRTPDSISEKEWMKYIWTMHASKWKEVDLKQKTANMVGRVVRDKPRSAMASMERK